MVAFTPILSVGTILLVVFFAPRMSNAAKLVSGKNIGCKHEVIFQETKIKSREPSSFNVILHNFGKHDFSMGMGNSKIYAHFESKDAIFSAMDVVSNERTNDIMVNFTAPLKGVYKAAIYHILIAEKLWVKLSTTDIVVQDNHEFSIPSEYCDFVNLQPSLKEGFWLKDNQDRNRTDFLRDRVVFSPRNCKYHIYGPSAVKQLQNHSHVVILGNSVSRGHFLSLADMLTHAGYNDMRKCWGWGSYKADDKMQISYQDFRSLIKLESLLDEFVCHNEVVASNGSYYDDSKKFITNLFESSALLPTTIVMQVGCVGSESSIETQLEILFTFLSLFPHAWNGNLILLSTLPNLLRAFENCMWEEFGLSIQRRMQTEPYSFRFFFFNIYELGYPFIWDMEGGPYSFTQHYHHKCKIGNRQSFCSPVTEMVAQMILNVEFRFTGMSNNKSLIRSSTKVEVCVDCPANLVPFQIKPVPDVHCAVLPKFPHQTSFYNSKTISEAAMPCPCLDTRVVRYEPSEGKPIAVRTCGSVIYPFAKNKGGD